MNRCGSQDFFCHGHNGTCTGQYRNGMDVAVHIQHSSATVDHTGKEIHVQTFRKPYGNFTAVDAGLFRGCNGCHHKGGAKLILILHAVSFPVLRIAVIHRQNQRNILCISPVIHGIKIGNQAVAETQEVRHNRTDLHGITPWLFTQEFTLAAVETVDG